MPHTRTVVWPAVMYLMLCTDIGREQAVGEHPGAGLAVARASLRLQRSLLPEIVCDGPFAWLPVGQAGSLQRNNRLMSVTGTRTTLQSPGGRSTPC